MKFNNGRRALPALVTALLLVALTAVTVATLRGLWSEPYEYEEAPIAVPAVTETQDLATNGPKEVIKSSIPTELYLPNKKKALKVKSEVLPLECGTGEIPYPQGKDIWKAFVCTDRGLPGTDTPFYGIITGHSATGAETVMNKFYQQGQGLVGQRVFVKTRASGKRWLVYQFREVYLIDKPKLGQAKVWGDENTSTAGRLVFLTCQQIAPHVKSKQNFVAVAQFVGVK